MIPREDEPLDEGILVRRMSRARAWQWGIAITSVLATAFGVIFLSPVEIGEFAYYTLAALLLLNATIALRQSAFYLFPVEKLLRQIRRVERDIDDGRLDNVHFSIHANDAFACLTAGVDSLVSKVAERARIASEQALQNALLLQSVPFAIYTVSDTGVVYTVIRDEYGIVPLLGIEVGQRPTDEKWGKENKEKYLCEVAQCFDVDTHRWFDLDVGTHHLRGFAKRLNAFTAIVMMGDMPSIDKLVTDTSGQSSESDYTHYQAVLKRFAASVSHDGRNIFAALSNLITVIKGSDDPDVRELVQVAEDAIHRGCGLMDELMTFAGEARYNFASMSAADVLRSLAENPTVKALVPKNIQLVTDLSEKPLPDIDVDAAQIWKVGFNLVKNAVEAMKGNDGRIWIKIKPCTMTENFARFFRHTGALHKGNGILITIADDGPGIPAEILGRIFEPYTSTKGGNRGIGLATVMTIVDAHSGGLGVKSSPGSGATFFIYLPASRNTAEEIKIIREVAPNGEILLVDDDPTILHTTGLVLRMLKIAAHPAATEEDALVKIRTLRSRIKAVLVDASLRGVSTAGLVRRIHAEVPDLPVVVVSGSPKETIDERFANVPYDKFLGKPYSVDELSAAISGLS